MRLNYLDYLKAFAIITVVIYHMGLNTEPIMQTLIHTQMPIFFLVSGYLTYKEKYNPLNNTIKKSQTINITHIMLWFRIISLKKYQLSYTITNTRERGILVFTYPF